MNSMHHPKSRPSRRTLLTGGSAALLASGLSSNALASHALASPAPTPEGAAPGPRQDGEAKKLLVLGGTKFLGPAVIEAALERGIEVTMFNRGETNPEMFPGVERLVGDRDPDVGDGLNALEGDRTWDYVLDTYSYVPRHTKAVAELLSKRVGQYVLISTISVYAALEEAGTDENAELEVLDDPTTEDVRANYGGLKALCEAAAEAALPGRTTLIRPGLIVGPRDPTGRFGYWPVRVAEGGEVLAPGEPNDPTQFIDVRDLAEFSLDCLERGTLGIFNAVGPNYGCTMAGLLYGCRAVVESDATFTWVPEEKLDELDLRAWRELPVWGSKGGINQVSAARAIEAGLRTRPLAETALGYLEWYRSLDESEQKSFRGLLSRERETEALRS